MSLITCPECAHEVSMAAAACPNCGHPFVRPAVAQPPRVVVQEFVEDDGGFPKWAFIPIGLLGVVLLFVLFAFLRNNNEDEAQRNINVRVAGQTNAANPTRETTVRPDTPPNQVVVPSTSQPSQVIAPPSSTSSSVPTTTTTVPSTAADLPPNKGTVNLEAKVASRTSNQPQAVRNTRFYLLKKDAETILNDADVDNDTGQSLLTAIGMSVVYPDRYGSLNRQAMSAISKNAVYSITTDASGKASLKDVAPDNYYLFAVTKSGDGYVLWNSPVTIQAGQNALMLPPASPTTVMQPEEEE